MKLYSVSHKNNNDSISLHLLSRSPEEAVIRWKSLNYDNPELQSKDTFLSDESIKNGWTIKCFNIEIDESYKQEN